MYLINGFDRAFLSFDSDLPTGSGQARGSLYFSRIRAFRIRFGPANRVGLRRGDTTTIREKTNRLFKAMSCTHTRYTRCPHAREMQYYLVFTYLHACMYQYHSHKTTCYSAEKQIMQLDFFSSFLTRKQHAYFQHHSHINCMLLRQELKSYKLKKISWFLAQKNNTFLQIFIIKKLHVINQK